MHDIIDTAAASGRLKTLANALIAAHLVDTLRSAGPFTVFAPTDEAFARLPAGTVDGLLGDIPRLGSVLNHHMLAGKVMATDVLILDGQSTKTVHGASLAISTEDGFILNGTARIVKSDIECSNGVIHVIDAVLIPS